MFLFYLQSSKYIQHSMFLIYMPITLQTDGVRKTTAEAIRIKSTLISLFLRIEHASSKNKTGDRTLLVLAQN